MKKLSIEEKAKRFDEALAMAKECITYVPDDAVNKYMLNMFPELKSEDERIRKVLIDYFKTYKEQEECGIKTFFGIPIDEVITWLEKQTDCHHNHQDANIQQNPADAYKLFAISAVEDYYDEKNPLRKDIVDWLKSLKDK